MNTKIVDLSKIDAALKRAEDDYLLALVNLNQRRARMDSIRLVREAYDGVKTTPEQCDPGKNQKAYYLKTETKVCPGCGGILPIIETLHQTSDGPGEGDDEWTKTFQIYCPECFAVTGVQDDDVRGYRF